MKLLISNLLEITVSQSIENKLSHQLTIYSLFFFFIVLNAKVFKLPSLNTLLKSKPWEARKSILELWKVEIN